MKTFSGNEDIQELIDLLIESDYYSNYYTMNGEISIHSLNAFFTLRGKAIQENPKINFTDVLVQELQWDDWDKTPAYVHKKSYENLLLVQQHNGSSTKHVYAIQMHGVNMNGIIYSFDWMSSVCGHDTNVELKFVHNRAILNKIQLGC